MNLPLFQVDAFARQPFQGNPAAVVPLQAWLPDALMQQVAAENQLSETAFFLPEKDGFALRWFTPAQEVDLCGHATLATAHILYTELGHEKPEVVFHTRSGPLRVQRAGDSYLMDLPAWEPQEVSPPEALLAGLGGHPCAIFKTRDYLVEYEREADILALQPNFERLREVDSLGVIVTAPGESVDFVSRFFAPGAGVPEDPVTGSAHSSLTPFWAQKLGKQQLRARQVSARGGELGCEWQGERVILEGQAVTFLAGTISLP
jgi:predicted PhzF superfamily epimerase YddE/YHI9